MRQVAIPALSVSDFDTVTNAEDQFSGLVLFVTLPNGAELELSVAYHLSEERADVSAVVHRGHADVVLPSIISHTFLRPCTSLPMLNASPAYVS